MRDGSMFIIIPPAVNHPYQRHRPDPHQSRRRRRHRHHSQSEGRLAKDVF